MKKMSLAKKIFIALILGCISGVIFNFIRQKFAFNAIEEILIDGVIRLIGQSFTNLIKSMVLPLVFVSISLGVASIGNLKKLGRVGSKIILFYLGTTMLAVSLAIFFTKFVDPATNNFHIASKNNYRLEQQNDNKEANNISISQTILDIIPVNPFKSLVEGNMLQIIFLAILVGIAVTLVEQKAEPIKKILESANEINLKIISLIMDLAPIGIFALITYTFSNFGLNIISSMAKYLFVIYLLLAFQALVVYSLMLKIFTRLSVKKFWKKFWPVASVAFSTASSNASLPISIKAADTMGVSRDISSFTLSLGATINMNGTAIMHGITVIFLSHIYNISLTMSDLIKVVTMSTLASIGTAGVPGVGMLMLAMVLKSVNIPVEGLGLVLGIDRIIDAGRTLVNVMGDNICTVIVADLEKELDQKKFDA